MITIDGLTVYFDVDQTLMMFRQGYIFENAFHTYANNRHIRALKEHHHRGHRIVVWSAGGAAWAQRAVKELGIEQFVDLCLSKPSWYYDDKSVTEFMPEVNRVYFDEQVTNNKGVKSE